MRQSEEMDLFFLGPTTGQRAVCVVSPCLIFFKKRHRRQKAEDEDAKRGKRRRKGDFFKREEPGETVETREESKARQLKNAHGWLRDLPERTIMTRG